MVLNSSGGFTAARHGVVARAGKGSHSLFSPLSLRRASFCCSSGRSWTLASRHRSDRARRCRSDGLPILFAQHWPLDGNRPHGGSHSFMKWTRRPNEVTAPNAGVALRFHGEHHWPGVGEFGRWATPVVTVRLGKLERLCPLTTLIFRIGNGQSKLCRQTSSEWLPSSSWQPVLQQPR